MIRFPFHRKNDGSNLRSNDLGNLVCSFNAHTRSHLYLATGIGISKKSVARSKRCKVGCISVIMQFYSMRLLPFSDKTIDHSIRVLVRRLLV